MGMPTSLPWEKLLDARDLDSKGLGMVLHALTRLIRLAGTYRDHLLQPYWRLLRTMSLPCFDNIPQWKLNNLFQCLTPPCILFFFPLVFKWNFMFLSFCPLPLVLSLVTTEESLAPSSLHPDQVWWKSYTWRRSPFQPYAQKPERLQNQWYKILWETTSILSLQ